MALNDITNKILEEAEVKKHQVEKETDALIKEIEKEEEEEILELEERHQTKLEREKRHKKQKAESRVGQKIKLIKESIRQKHVNKVFDDVYQNLVNLPAQEYKAMISSLLKEVPKTMQGVIKVPDSRLEETKQVLQEQNLSFGVESDSDLEGGFQILGDKNNFNYSFERIVSGARDNYELEIADLLFRQKG